MTRYTRATTTVATLPDVDRHLAALLSVMPNPNALTLKPDSGWPMPATMLGWALYWQSRGLRLFPATRFTGLPLVPHWPSAASNTDRQIVEWWSEIPDADIAAIPDAAGCFVIAAVGDEGRDNLDMLAGHYGEPLIETEGADGTLHIWLPGRAPSQRLTDGLYVFGVGSYLYMPGSLAPDPVARFDSVREAA
jgi:bifunctional DNA primase/polymerase-like protein